MENMHEKPDYQKPELMDLNVVNESTAACGLGSGDSGECGLGNSAGTACSSGNNASTGCGTGNSPGSICSTGAGL